MHLCLWPCSLDNTLNRPSSASFNYLAKPRPVCFGDNSHIESSRPTVFVKLMRVGRWVYHSGVKIWRINLKYQSNQSIKSNVFPCYNYTSYLFLYLLQKNILILSGHVFEYYTDARTHMDRRNNKNRVTVVSWKLWF